MILKTHATEMDDKKRCGKTYKKITVVQVKKKSNVWCGVAFTLTFDWSLRDLGMHAVVAGVAAAPPCASLGILHYWMDWSLVQWLCCLGRRRRRQVVATPWPRPVLPLLRLRLQQSRGSTTARIAPWQRSCRPQISSAQWVHTARSSNRPAVALLLLLWREKPRR